MSSIREVEVCFDGLIFRTDYWESGALRLTAESRSIPFQSIESWLKAGCIEVPFAVPPPGEVRPGGTNTVTQLCKLLYRGFASCVRERGRRLAVFVRSAGCKPAIRQVLNLRYGRACVALFLWFAVAGCAGPRPLRPGTASMRSAAGPAADFSAALQQPENPAQAAAQTFERTVETELALPPGTIVGAEAEGRTSKVKSRALGAGGRRSEAGGRMSGGEERRTRIVLSEPSMQRTRVTEKAGTTVGAAQKDTAREIGAKLASLRGVVWVGIALFVLGLASLVWPPLRAIVGSITTSLAAMAGGTALMILPSLVAGHELLILGGVGVAVGGWFLAHRHGKASAAAQALAQLGKAVGGQKEEA